MQYRGIALGRTRFTPPGVVNRPTPGPSGSPAIFAGNLARAFGTTAATLRLLAAGGFASALFVRETRARNVHEARR